jgi:hypothetical protein
MGDDEDILAQLVARCWRDDSFKKRFMTDPKGVLAENGLEVEAGCDIKVVEDNEKVTHIVLPIAPPKGELSDDELEAVAGGSGHFSNKLPVAVIRTTTTTSYAPH